MPVSRTGRPAVIVSDLSLRHADGRAAIDRLSLSIEAREIVGVAGVGGNGQSDLVEGLIGLRKAAGGSVSIDGRDILGLSPRMRRHAGLRVVPADRFDYGLVRDMSVAGNLALTRLGDGMAAFFDRHAAAASAADLIARYDVRGAAPERRIGLLSGGNAQKVLLAREIDDGARLLVVHSPTRGLDVAASAAVRAAIRQAAAAGVACLVISEDLDELGDLCDRLAVINRGKVCEPMPIAEATPERIGALMIGHA
jgi:simple sugar transport system ATP-binding protein